MLGFVAVDLARAGRIAAQGIAVQVGVVGVALAAPEAADPLSKKRLTSGYTMGMLVSVTETNDSRRDQYPDSAGSMLPRCSSLLAEAFWSCVGGGGEG